MKTQRSMHWTGTMLPLECVRAQWWPVRADQQVHRRSADRLGLAVGGQRTWSGLRDERLMSTPKAQQTTSVWTPHTPNTSTPQQTPPPVTPPPAATREPISDTAEEPAEAEFSRFGPDYEHLELITRTRLSLTYKAHNKKRNAWVVIKELHPELVAQREAVARFKHEVEIVARLTSKHIIPHVVQVWEIHLDDWPYHFTMPLCEGDHLDAYCETRQLGLQDRLRLFLKVCAPVSRAHQKAVIHRDLKPNNIIVDREGQPHLLDFGLGRMTMAGASAENEEREAVLGALGYMAPEQAARGPHDVRTDVYALGALLYEMLTRELPIPVDSALDINDSLKRIQSEQPRDPRQTNQSIDWELSLILLRALEKDPDDRYGSVESLCEAIRDYLARRPVEGLVEYGRWWASCSEDRQPPPTFSWYRFMRWLQRNTQYVALGAVLLLAGLGIAGWEAHSAYAAYKAKEEDRHAYAVLAGRHWTERDNPAKAHEALWNEFEDYPDDPVTRYALLEHYLRYPCLHHVPDRGRQLEVAYSPDGRWLVSVTDGRELIIYHAADAAVADAISGDDAHARSIAFTPDGSRLYVGGCDGILRVWAWSGSDNLDEADPAFTSQVAPQGAITAVAVSPDGQWLATGLREPVSADETENETCGTVCLWRLDSSGQPVKHVWEACDLGTAIADLAFSPDSSLLSCGAEGGGWRVWEVTTGEHVVTKNIDRRHCRGVGFSADGRRLYLRVASNRVERLGTVHVLRSSVSPQSGHATKPAAVPDTGSSATLSPNDFRCQVGPEPLAQTPIVGWGIRSIATTTRNGEDLIAYGCGDGMIHLYEWRRQRPARTFAYHDFSGGNDIGVSFSPDGTRLASVGPDGLKLWDTSGPTSVALAAEGQRKWRGGKCVSWGSETCVLLNYSGPVQSSRSETSLLVAFDLQHGELWRYAGDTGESLPSPEHYSLTADGTTLAVESRYWLEEDVRMVRLALINTFSQRAFASRTWPSEDRVTPCWYEADGERRILFGVAPTAPDSVQQGFCSGIYAWQMTAPDQMHGAPELLLPLADTCSGICVSDDGQFIAVTTPGDNDTAGTLTVLRSTGRNSNHPFTDSFTQMKQVDTYGYCWTPVFVRDADDTLLVATGGSGRDVYLHHIFGDALPERMSGHRDSVCDCQPYHQHYLVTTSKDRRVLLWHVPSRREVCELYRADSEVPYVSVSGDQILVSEENRLTVLNLEDLYQRFIAPRAAR